MKAFIHKGKSGIEGTSVCEMAEPEVNEGEVKVSLKYAGLNHRDLFVLQRHQETEPALIIGSDGAGIVEQIGSGVTNVQIGDEVVINPSLGWYEKSDAPPEGFEILGLPNHGTFAEKLVVSADNVERKPPHLSWEEAGVLPLAALTAYRALFTRANIQPNQTLFLPGVGSGAVTFLLLFAKAAGAKVIVTSRSETKRKRALALGADRALDSNGDWQRALHDETIDVVIETVGAATFNKSLSVLKRGGKMITFGASAGDEVEFNIREFFYGQYSLFGTTMGSREEFKEMLQFITQHNIKPVIDTTYKLVDARKAFEHMNAAEQFGKIGIQIQKSSF